MSDEGDKTCPLCAEEMDLTDQQLKPCKCGYEICVWCWHHIMDMAEKDEAQGRCPACRTPYNKEKIVGTAAKFEKVVTEFNLDKKHKSQKGKSKTSDGRKQLESVRVLQRNLVYVVGLPLNYADEDILQRKDYFSQYGKVLKVSISRTATGAIQQFANNTCSVYITYSKEEEAVRCIQSVHGFVLDGKSLRACFGTTKYCHAWLRNVPCGNKDCLYLHEIGSQEDSFTKDEIISAYTRNRVQQTTGSSNSNQRRAGNVLPPPGDECYNNCSTSGKPITKAAIHKNNVASNARVSPPNSSSGGIAALPAGASWGTRPANNSQPSPASTPYFNAPPTQKSDISNDPVAISKKSSITGQVFSSLQSDSGKKKVQNQENISSREKMKKEISGSKEKESNADCRIPISDGSVASVHLVNLPPSRQPRSTPKINLPPDSSKIVDSSVLSTGLMPENKSIDHTDGIVETICSSILSMSIRESQQVQNGYVEHNREALIHQVSAKPANTIDRCRANGLSDLGTGTQSKLTQVDWQEREDDLLSFDNQRINDPEVAPICRVQEFPDELNLSKHSDSHSHEFSNTGGSVGIASDRQVVDRNGNLVVPTLNFPIAHSNNLLNSFEGNDTGNFNLFPIKESGSLPRRCEGEASSYDVNMGESSIISNILSMDFDPWNESLTSPQNLAKLLGETDKREGSFGVSGSWKIPNSNQSRFSFAREGETMNHVHGSGQSIDYLEHACRWQQFGQDISSSNSLYLGRPVGHNGLPVFGGTEPDSFAGSCNSHLSSNKLSASRSHLSAPPGFSVPNRAAPPPPGFASHDRTGTEPIFEPVSGNHMHDGSLSLLRNQYQTSPNSNTFSNGDLEFMDPAILAVGKGTLPGGNNNPGLDMRSIFPQLNTYEDTRFQSLLQRSLLPHQNQRFDNDLQDGFSTLVDAYGLPSRIVDQTPSNTLSPFSQFNLPPSRNGINPNGSNSVMSELLRSERLGFNKFYGGYEDSKIHSPSPGNIYNNTYGI